jgi:hypothetical protein
MHPHYQSARLPASSSCTANFKPGSLAPRDRKRRSGAQQRQLPDNLPRASAQLWHVSASTSISAGAAWVHPIVTTTSPSGRLGWREQNMTHVSRRRGCTSARHQLSARHVISARHVKFFRCGTLSPRLPATLSTTDVSRLHTSGQHHLTQLLSPHTHELAVVKGAREPAGVAARLMTPPKLLRASNHDNTSPRSMVPIPGRAAFELSEEHVVVPRAGVATEAASQLRVVLKVVLHVEAGAAPGTSQQDHGGLEAQLILRFAQAARTGVTVGPPSSTRHARPPLRRPFPPAAALPSPDQPHARAALHPPHARPRQPTSAERQAARARLPQCRALT